MTAGYLKIALLLTVLWLVPVLLIRAQPYDDGGLWAFLTPPEGCLAPCFMGIRPGVTTVDEAIAILEGHEWVDKVTVEDQGGFHLFWTWSGQQPHFIRTSSTGRIRRILFQDVVELISIDTRITIGELYLTLGLPDKVSIQKLEEISIQVLPYRTLYAEYSELSLGILTIWGCPVVNHIFWRNLSSLFWDTSFSLLYTVQETYNLLETDHLIYPRC